MRCYKCFRKKEFCLCSYAQPQIECGVKFIFLMHPKEAKRERTGTGYLAHLCLKDSEIFVGLEFEKNIRLNELLRNEKFFPVLMYPVPDAQNAKSAAIKNKICSKNKNALNSNAKIFLPIIIDATWFCAKKIIQKNPFLLSLPKFSFAKNYSSIFTFKREPRPECVSTIETCYYLIKELQKEGFVKKSVNAEPLMNIFKKMILVQLQAENERIQGLRKNSHAYDWKYTQTKKMPF